MKVGRHETDLEETMQLGCVVQDRASASLPAEEGRVVQGFSRGEFCDDPADDVDQSREAVGVDRGDVGLRESIEGAVGRLAPARSLLLGLWSYGSAKASLTYGETHLLC